MVENLETVEGNQNPLQGNHLRQLGYFLPVFFPRPFKTLGQDRSMNIYLFHISALTCPFSEREKLESLLKYKAQLTLKMDKLK